MGFWGTLGKIGAVAAPFAAMAIPGVGPAVGGALKGIMSNPATGAMLGNLGGILGQQAGGAAQGRREDSRAMVGAQAVNLQQQQLEDRRAALASLLQGGLQDVSIGRPAGSTIPTFSVSGGLRPSAMNQQSLLQQLGQKIQPLELPKPGLGEKIMGGVGIGANILGALGQLGRRPSVQTPPFNPGASGAINPALLGNVRF